MIGPKVTLELRRKTEINDGMGGAILVWSGLRKIKGTLSTINGDERLSADKLTVIQTQNFYIDYPIGIILTEEDEFYWGQRRFKITFINSIGANRNLRLKITLKEETYGGEGIVSISDYENIGNFLNYNKIIAQHFQDLLTADIDGIHTAITGTGAEQEITTNITNPDYARNISLTVTNIAAPSGNVVITGIIRGVIDSESIAIIAGGIAYGNKAYDTVAKITIPAGVTVADTVTVGFSDKIGLSSKISSISSVYKKKVNNIDKTSELIGKVDAAYHTVNCSPVLSNQDMELRYIKE